MKKRVVTLLLCLVLVVLSLLRGFAASAAGIIPATNADFDVPCAAAILIDEDSGTVLYEKNADARRPIASITKVCCWRLRPSRRARYTLTILSRSVSTPTTWAAVRSGSSPASR